VPPAKRSRGHQRQFTLFAVLKLRGVIRGRYGAVGSSRRRGFSRLSASRILKEPAPDLRGSRSMTPRAGSTRPDNSVMGMNDSFFSIEPRRSLSGVLAEGVLGKKLSTCSEKKLGRESGSLSRGHGDGRRLNGGEDNSVITGRLSLQVCPFKCWKSFPNLHHEIIFPTEGM
jgi:hypothetical protein